jgi:malate permease and related proteins
MGIADVRRSEPDGAFLGLMLLAKFVAWPLAVGALVALDCAMFGLLSREARRVLILLSFVPIAANTVAVASSLGIEPEKSAVAVLASTLMATVTIPLATALGPG